MENLGLCLCILDKSDDLIAFKQIESSRKSLSNFPKKHLFMKPKFKYCFGFIISANIFEMAALAIASPRNSLFLCCVNLP